MHCCSENPERRTTPADHECEKFVRRGRYRTSGKQIGPGDGAASCPLKNQAKFDAVAEFAEQIQSEPRYILHQPFGSRPWPE
jgi:hypothetical protein